MKRQSGSLLQNRGGREKISKSPIKNRKIYNSIFLNICKKVLTWVRGAIGKSVALLCHYRWEMTYDMYRKRYFLDSNFSFNGPGVKFYGNGKITASCGSYIGRYSSINSAEDCNVKIGKYVSISHFVKIYTQSYLADQDFSILNNKEKLKTKKGDIVIGNYSWIGASVFICPGVRIGENCVVGANSVVTKDIPPNCIVAGAPAKVIKRKSV